MKHWSYRQKTGQLKTRSKKKIRVFLTVDTEHSIGGAFSNPKLKPVNKNKRIYGKIGKKNFGIPLMMDLADRYGLKMVFFLEVLNKYYFGEDESKQVCQYILKRNHDVQLHIHPNYLNFTRENPGNLVYSDFISDYPQDRQEALLSEARDLLIKYGAPNPSAFRAGCFGAGLSTLRALKKSGFLIDSSYNRSYCGITCSIPKSAINDLVNIEGIWEFPVTNFIEHSYLRSTRYMPLDINGVSFSEIKNVLEQSRKNGPSNITIILHSFSFIRAYDVQYNRVKPRNTVIKRFESLCRYLAENRDHFEVGTFGSMTGEALSGLPAESLHHIHRMPPIHSLFRGCEQVKDAFF